MTLFFIYKATEFHLKKKSQNSNKPSLFIDLKVFLAENFINNFKICKERNERLK